MGQLLSGQMLGPYRIIEQIGQGGMATVYKAYHAAMDRYVAIKVLSSDLARDMQLKGRFQQEARLIANLEHAHILPVHDFGESDGLYYIVMRYLDTGTLKERIQAGPLSLAEIGPLFSQLADALGYAHDHGVLHRDIKPSNVLLDNRGNVFLSDFGIAKLMEGTIQFTVSGTITGTPAYMSPEQAQGEVLDPRSDIYSLGIILYEMVTGRVPFEAETPLAVILKHLQAPLPLPTHIRPEVHPAVERILLKALAKNRQDRYATCQEFLAAWKDALAQVARSPVKNKVGTATGSLAKPQPARRKSEAPTVIETSPGQTAPEAAVGSRKMLWIAGAIVAVAILILAAVWIGVRLARPETASPGDEAEISAATQMLKSESATQPGVSTPAPALSSQAFTSWSSANLITDVQIYGEEIYTAGPGGITVWSRRDGSILRRITAADGLDNTQILALHKEGNEWLWVGTEEGLFQISGDEVTAHRMENGLDSNYISALITLQDGRLLAATHYAGFNGGGLNVLDNQVWQAYDRDFPSVYEDEAASEQLSYTVNALLDEGSSVWVGTSAGLGRHKDQTWTLYYTDDGLPSNNVFSLFLDHAGRLVVGTERGAAIFNGERFEALAQGPPDGVYGIAEAPDNVYWLSGGGGIWRYDSTRSTWRVFNAESGDLPVYGLYGAQADLDGNIYLGSHGAGLAVVRPDFSIDFWTVPNTPFGSSFSGILPAPDGKLWFLASNAASVDVFDPQQGLWNRPLENMPGFPIAVDGFNRVWMNEWPSGFWIVSPAGEEIHITDRQGLPVDAYVNSVALVDQTAWLGTSVGLARFDGEKIIEVIPGTQIGFLEDGISRVFIDSANELWVVGYFGFARRASGEDWETFGYQNPFEEDGVQVNDIAQDKEGAIWAATSSGVYRFWGGEWTFFTRGDPKVELPSAMVLCVTSAPDGSLWFGTYDGAARFDGSGWQSFAAGPAGLISRQVFDIFAAESGEVFFATEGGVTRLKP